MYNYAQANKKRARRKAIRAWTKAFIDIGPLLFILTLLGALAAAASLAV